jgi:hypothetical protein
MCVSSWIGLRPTGEKLNVNLLSLPYRCSKKADALPVTVILGANDGAVECESPYIQRTAPTAMNAHQIGDEIRTRRLGPSDKNTPYAMPSPSKHDKIKTERSTVSFRRNASGKFVFLDGRI